MSSRARAALVVTTVACALALAGTTTFAAAHHDGDASTLHACITKGDGQVRLLLDPSASCRRSETPVEWSVGGGASELAALRAALREPDDRVNDDDGLLHWTNVDGVPRPVLDASDQLAAFITSLANESASDDGLVHWSNLHGVPAGLQDGVHPDDLLGDLMAAHIAAGAVGTEEILDGAVWSAKLAERAVGTQHLQEGAVRARHLAGSDEGLGVPGAVTSEKILDGTVAPRDLGLHPVLAADAGSTVPAEQAREYALAVVGVSASDDVLLTAQAQLACTSCTAGGASRITYELVRRGPGGATTSVTGAYVLTLSQHRVDDLVSLSLVDADPPVGTTGYSLRVTNPDAGAADVQVSQVRLDALVL